MKDSLPDVGQSDSGSRVPTIPDRRWRSNRPQPKQRFKIIPFLNRAGSQSWRVSGIKRDGARVRENFGDSKAAHCRLIDLEAEYLGRAPDDAALRATRLTDTQLKIAEAVFPRLHADEELLSAVDYWIKKGREQAVTESPRLDDAVEQFKSWLDADASLRPLSKQNLKIRISIFASSVPNVRVSDITPELIEAYLGKRDVSAATRDNDKRVVSRFCAWCIERPRRWIAHNPAREVRVFRGEKGPPAILTVAECEKLLRKADTFKRGRLAPYVAVCLFGGLRPFEAARLNWKAVNLTDGEIRLEANQTKTGRNRVIAFNDGPPEQAPFNAALKAWLTAHKGKPFYPANWCKDFDRIKRAAGFGGRVNPDDKPGKLKPWPVDVMRHAAVSFFFRLTGSYGRTAEMFGNSEAIIKSSYQGRVNSEDTKKFYALRPKKGAGK